MLHTIFQAFSPDVLENLTARAFVVCEGAHKGVESMYGKRNVPLQSISMKFAIMPLFELFGIFVFTSN